MLKRLLLGLAIALVVGSFLAIVHSPNDLWL